MSHSVDSSIKAMFAYPLFEYPVFMTFYWVMVLGGAVNLFVVLAKENLLHGASIWMQFWKFELEGF